MIGSLERARIHTKIKLIEDQRFDAQRNVNLNAIVIGFGHVTLSQLQPPDIREERVHLSTKPSTTVIQQFAKDKNGETKKILERNDVAMTSRWCPIFTNVEFQRLFVFSSSRLANDHAPSIAQLPSTSTMKLPPPSAGDSYVVLESTSTPPFSPSDRSPPVPAMMIKQGVTREMSVVRSALNKRLYLLLRNYSTVGLPLFSLQL